PATPRGDRQRDHRHQRDDEIAVAVPERLEILELFLLFQVVGHGLFGFSSQCSAIASSTRSTTRASGTLSWRAAPAAARSAAPSPAAGEARSHFSDASSRASSSTPRISANCAPPASARRNCALQLPPPHCRM